MTSTPAPAPELVEQIKAEIRAYAANPQCMQQGDQSRLAREVISLHAPGLAIVLERLIQRALDARLKPEQTLVEACRKGESNAVRIGDGATGLRSADDSASVLTACNCGAAGTREGHEPWCASGLKFDLGFGPLTVADQIAAILGSWRGNDGKPMDVGAVSWCSEAISSFVQAQTQALTDKAVEAKVPPGTRISCIRPVSGHGNIGETDECGHGPGYKDRCGYPDCPYKAHPGE